MENMHTDVKVQRVYIVSADNFPAGCFSSCESIVPISFKRIYENYPPLRPDINYLRGGGGNKVSDTRANCQTNKEVIISSLSHSP